MEEAIKDQPSANGKSKLRYPLRSALKSKEEKQSATDTSNSSATKRGKTASKVSQSVSVLDLSAKDTAAKPPRRFSIPNASPHMKPAGTITPISETRAKRSIINQGKSNTPASDVTKSGARKNLSYIASASYWLSQIKLSESAAMHSVSLGFFKLALEAGCKPLQRMREELKSYARRHSLVELGESVKEIFISYDISENLDQLQVSETCSLPGEGTRLSDDDVHSSSSTRGTKRLKPKSLNIDAAQVSSVTESANTETTQKNYPAARTRGSSNRNQVNSRSTSDSQSRNIQRKLQKPSKQDSKTEKAAVKKVGKKSANEEGPVSSSPTEVTTTLQENKENMVNQDVPQMEETSLTEVM